MEGVHIGVLPFCSLTFTLTPKIRERRPVGSLLSSILGCCSSGRTTADGLCCSPFFFFFTHKKPPCFSGCEWHFTIQSTHFLFYISSILVIVMRISVYVSGRDGEGDICTHIIILLKTRLVCPSVHPSSKLSSRLRL